MIRYEDVTQMKYDRSREELENKLASLKRRLAILRVFNILLNLIGIILAIIFIYAILWR